MESKLSHVDDQGRARMVDVGSKPPMRRRAVAAGEVVMQPANLDKLLAGDLPKGEALGVARIAGVMAGKRTGELIPLCHPLPIEAINVDFDRIAPDRLQITATATITAKTGVEMEALTAVTIACLTIYDMAKAVDKTMRIENVRLVEKVKEGVGDGD